MTKKMTKKKGFTSEEKNVLKKVRASPFPNYFICDEEGSISPKKGISEEELDRLIIKLFKATGTYSCKAMEVLLAQAAATQGIFIRDKAEAANTALKILSDINPQTTLEGLLATQMLGVHNLAMDMMKRVNLSETVDAVDRNISRATKLTRIFVAQVEALNKLRGGGNQTVRVEHVTVNEGGQAIVGNVEHKGGRG